MDPAALLRASPNALSHVCESNERSFATAATAPKIPEVAVRWKPRS
jgi:hypothetical protein